jgi:hypothetical protein
MAKKKEMNRTSGTAKRKISQAEEIRYGMKTGKPLTGSASGVKSISLKQAGEALTQGIVTTRGGKLQFAPEGLAMALPVGKVLKAAKVLRAAGNIGKADALTARVVAKAAGGSRAAARAQREQRAIAVMRPEWPGVFGPSASRKAGDRARGISEELFPRSTEGLSKKASKETMERVATKGFTKSEIDSFTEYAEKYYADQARLRAKFGKGK